ncbi:hypothetical protein [Litchfieldella xinjiangensis]|uniref:hypothetical protein n=1 Tax=Litchfieldella xinjiangensis TaxID=1166948 RepID=UPI0005B81CD8|nr:hypothetical protein [Halomonas xinjiangensis]
MSIDKALHRLEAFKGDSLARNLSEIERRLIDSDVKDLADYCATRGIDDEFMDSAIAVKQVAGEINVIIHAAGILRSLPGLLEPGEKVESLSLGAGNTGRQFDLETNKRIAEYKFIDWRGGSESIRQNGIFKDFFELAEHETHKKKYLYVVGTRYPLKFLQGGRALSSVLSRYPLILSQIQKTYGASMIKVRDYYAIKKNDVAICDVTPYIGRATE